MSCARLLNSAPGCCLLDGADSLTLWHLSLRPHHVWCTDPCGTPGYCNGREANCTAGRCECRPGFSGGRCETLSAKTEVFTFDGAAYTLVTAPELPWHEAEQFCQRQGQHLVRLHSALHAAKFSDAVLSKYAWARFWIGLSDEKKEGEFVWSADDADAGPVASPASWRGPFPWFPGEPNNVGGEHCVLLCVELVDDLKARVAFYDESCASRRMFVCSDGAVPRSACMRTPCSLSGEAEPTCSDVAGAPASAGPDGRTCSCPDGFLYADDALGCVQPLDAREFSVNGVLHRLFLAPRLTWAGADRLCRKNGTQLVEPRSSAQMVELQAAVLTALEPSSFVSYWIGLSDRAREGSFVWSSDNSTASYSNWATSEPNNSCGSASLYLCWLQNGQCRYECMPGEDCAEVKKDDGSWNDEACFNRRSFVCSERT